MRRIAEFALLTLLVVGGCTAAWMGGQSVVEARTTAQ